jgi:hypothetical protein
MQTLVYTSRKLRVIGRPKYRLPQGLPLIPFPWKALFYQPRMRQHFSQAFRPKHRIFPPAQAVIPGLPGAGRIQYLYYVSRKIRAQVRRKQLPLFIAASAAGFVPKKQKLRYRPRQLLKKFFRHKTLWFKMVAPPPPVGFIVRPNKLLRVKRKKFFPNWLFPLWNRVYEFPGTPTPPPPFPQPVPVPRKLKLVPETWTVWSNRRYNGRRQIVKSWAGNVFSRR